MLCQSITILSHNGKHSLRLLKGESDFHLQLDVQPSKLFSPRLPPAPSRVKRRQQTAEDMKKKAQQTCCHVTDFTPHTMTPADATTTTRSQPSVRHASMSRNDPSVIMQIPIRNVLFSASPAPGVMASARMKSVMPNRWRLRRQHGFWSSRRDSRPASHRVSEHGFC